jgi:hypothetical protein
MEMSVLCAVQFADSERTVTRMTMSSDCFYDSHGNVSHGFEIGRVLSLAVAAYESRMKRPPPLIKEPELIAGFPDILQYQCQTMDGKITTVTAAQYRRDLLFTSIFRSIPKRDASAEPQPKRRQPRIRSMAEWHELQRQKNLRKLARVTDANLQREILKTMDTCPCCNQPLGDRLTAAGGKTT